MHSDSVGVIDFPHLGDLIDGWIEQHCVIPGGFKRGRPFRQYDWQFWCTANHYRIREDAQYNPDDPPMNQAFEYRLTQVVAPQKALALDTAIATPVGWTTMGEVQAGDYVFDECGNPTRVLSKSQIWETTSYEVRFSDHSSLIACGDHEWPVDRRTSSGTYVAETIRTEDLVGNLVDPGGARRFRIRNAEPLNLPDADLPIDPYTLGAWLGDGNSDDGRITGIDREIFDHIADAGYEVRQMKVAKRVGVVGLKGQLRKLGVLRNKHIPAAYLRGSEKQRLALLQGLMDTDGYCCAKGNCEFTTTLPALRDGIRELLNTLGIRNRLTTGLATLYGRVTGPKYRISFTIRSDVRVFHLDRKQDRVRPAGSGHAQNGHRRIVSVERIPTVPTQCLTVEANSHIFLAGREMIPTCNTGKGPWAACLTCVSAVGPELFGGWAKRGDEYRCDLNGCSCGWYFQYEIGEPMGVRHPSPLIQLTANSADQVKNVWDPLNSMIRRQGSRLKELLLPRGEFIRVVAGENADPETDRIDMVTSSARSRIGNPISDYLHDESGLYTKHNGMVDVADAQERGAAGMSGRGKQTTNCWDPAMESFAQTYFEADMPDVFSFYRNPDLNRDLFGSDDKPLPYSTKANRRKIHAYVYEGSDHVNLDSIEALAAKLAITDPAQSERFFGNRIVAGGGAWLEEGVWDTRRADVAA